jgi:hypothetical protein
MGTPRMDIKELCKIEIASNILRFFSMVDGYMIVNAGNLQIRNVIR